MDSNSDLFKSSQEAGVRGEDPTRASNSWLLLPSFPHLRKGYLPWVARVATE